MEVSAASSRTFTEYRHAVRVSTERFDVVTYPAQCCHLVFHSVITRTLCIFCTQETCRHDLEPLIVTIQTPQGPTCLFALLIDWCKCCRSFPVRAPLNLKYVSKRNVILHMTVFENCRQQQIVIQRYLPCQVGLTTCVFSLSWALLLQTSHLLSRMGLQCAYMHMHMHSACSYCSGLFVFNLAFR